MHTNNLLDVKVNRDGHVSRRKLLQLGGAGMLGSTILGQIGLSAEKMKSEGRSAIMIFLDGAPSQMEMFDPKPGTDNGGPTKTIKTAIPGFDIAEYWPRMAKTMKDFAVIRSVAGKEAAHERGRYHLQTGHRLVGTDHFPHIGSVIAKEIGDPDTDIPNFVSLGGNTYGSGFLGVPVAPLKISRAGQLPANISSLVPQDRMKERMALLRENDIEFYKQGAQKRVRDHQLVYQKAAKMMTSDRLKAFKFDGEPKKLMESYGNSEFGRSLVIARRLVESNIPFIEVKRGGWDNHDYLWTRFPKQANEIDLGITALISDLKARGLFEKTLVIMLGEFGRTPRINDRRAPNVGRDHWSRNFNVALAGGGIKGGQVIGKTSDDGMEISDRPVEVTDLFRSLYKPFGIDPDEEYYTPAGRPLKIVDGGEVVSELYS